jgi:putative DNA methylase
LFITRQLLALGTFVKHTRAAYEMMRSEDYPPKWVEAIGTYLATVLDRSANQGSAVSRWNQGGEKIEGTFARFALPLLWDFAEVNPLGDTTGSYSSAFEWVTLATAYFSATTDKMPAPQCICESAIAIPVKNMDVIVTDPPYYDAIPYADLMDFFYIWLRRTLNDLSSGIDRSLKNR